VPEKESDEIVNHPINETKKEEDLVFDIDQEDCNVLTTRRRICMLQKIVSSRPKNFNRHLKVNSVVGLNI